MTLRSSCRFPGGVQTTPNVPALGPHEVLIGNAGLPPLDPRLRQRAGPQLRRHFAFLDYPVCTVGQDHATLPDEYGVSAIHAQAIRAKLFPFTWREKH